MPGKKGRGTYEKKGKGGVHLKAFHVLKEKKIKERGEFPFWPFIRAKFVNLPSRRKKGRKEKSNYCRKRTSRGKKQGWCSRLDHVSFKKGD